MAKMVTIDKDELEVLKQQAEQARGVLADVVDLRVQKSHAEVRAGDAEAGEKRAHDEAVEWHRKWQTVAKTLEAETAARVRAERDRFDALSNKQLRSLLWLQENVVAAITRHPAYISLTRSVPEIAAREFRKEVKAEMWDSAENGLLIYFVGDVAFDFVVAWDVVDAIGSLESHPIAEGADEHARYEHEIKSYAELLTGMVRELLG